MDDKMLLLEKSEFEAKQELTTASVADTSITR